MEQQDGSEDVEVTGLSLDAVSQEGACARNKADEQIKQGLMDTEGRPRGAGAEGAAGGWGKEVKAGSHKTVPGMESPAQRIQLLTL